METHRRGAAANTLKLLVLVPHRDTRLPLRAWSGALFAAGACGAWSFPWVAPLALLSRPFSAEELKHCAHILREQNPAAHNSGKLKTGAAVSAAFPAGCFGALHEEPALFGPVLNIATPFALCADTAAKKIIYHFSPPVLGCALVYGSDTEQGSIPPAPALSFRAAALANMSYRPLAGGDGAYSFMWKIRRLYWLPPVKKSTGRAERRGKGLGL